MEIKVDFSKEMDSLKEFISKEISRLTNSLQGKKQNGVESSKHASGQSSVDQIAKEYKVSKLTVYNWIKKNKLKSTKMGRNIMIAEADLSKFFDKNSRIKKRISNKTTKKKKAGRPKGRKKSK